MDRQGFGPNKEEQARTSNLERNRTMTGNNVWVASFAAAVIAIVLLSAGSPSVTANDQPSAANAEVKIDNFSFGPQTVTVPVGASSDSFWANAVNFANHVSMFAAPELYSSIIFWNS